MLAAVLFHVLGLAMKSHEHPPQASPIAMGNCYLVGYSGFHAVILPTRLLDVFWDTAAGWLQDRLHTWSHIWSTAAGVGHT